MDPSAPLLAKFLLKVYLYEPGVFCIIKKIYEDFTNTYPELTMNQIRDYTMLNKKFSSEFSLSTVKQINSVQITEMIECINKPTCMYFEKYEVCGGTKELVGKYIQLKMKFYEKEGPTAQLGLSMYYIKKLSFEKIDNMILMMLNNVKEPYLYWYAFDYKGSQINHIIEMKKVGIGDIWCGEVLKYFNEKQIKEMIYAKKNNKYGIIKDSALYRIVRYN